jgi:hypothetical protein
MCATFCLTIRRPLNVMDLVLRHFPSDATLTLVGDLSQLDTEILPTASWIRLDCEIDISLDPAAIDALLQTVFPRVGLRKRVWHVVLRSAGKVVFAAYDSFADEQVVLGGPGSVSLMQTLRDQNLIVTEREIASFEE